MLLLWADNMRPIDGMTKLQKLVFLVQMEVLHTNRDMGVKFEFRPDRFGPLAPELYDEIDFLASVDMLARDGSEMSITKKGTIFFETRSRPRIPDAVYEAITSIKERHGRESLDSLLKHVYTKYPEFATKSEILDRVLG